MSRCPQCGEFLGNSTTDYEYNECGLRVTLENIPTTYCRNCPYSAVDIPNIIQLHKEIAKNLASKPLPLNVSEVKFLTTYLNWNDEPEGEQTSFQNRLREAVLYPMRFEHSKGTWNLV